MCFFVYICIVIKNNNIMKIKIEKSGEGYYADFIELTGSPAVGTGKTKEDAMATLFIRNIDKLPLLDTTYLEINGTPYEDYIKFNR